MLERVIRISSRLVKKFNLNTTDLMLKATIYDFGFDKKGYESFYFDNDNQFLEFATSLEMLNDVEVKNVGGREILVG